MVQRCKKIAAWGIGVFVHVIKTVFLMQNGCCRFTPSCTDFAKDAISNLPLLTAIPLIWKRIIKCHPFSQGGFDPVPDGYSNRKGYVK